MVTIPVVLLGQLDRPALIGHSPGGAVGLPWQSETERAAVVADTWRRFPWESWEMTLMLEVRSS